LHEVWCVHVAAEDQAALDLAIQELDVVAAEIPLLELLLACGPDDVAQRSDARDFELDLVAR
jgi:hypothetical protein